MTGAFIQRVRILRFADFDFLLRSSFKMEQALNHRKRFSSNDSSEVDNKKPLLETDRVKRKKSAVLLAYSGVGYLGMQRNPGMKTIEEDLLQALLKSGYINDDAFATPQNIQFQRAARTDKGVSAARQVISAKLPEEINISNINENLPEQIRVLSVKRTTKGFNSKSACNARTYSYTLPTFAFSLPGESMENYRITTEVIDKVNSTLQLFEGTHNFHNFTSRKRPLDPSAHRYIMKFECSQPFVCEDLELATIKVKGQSFMLHQIRKMIGLTIAVVRGHTTADTIEKAWKHERLDIPVAPGLGLVLDEVHYDHYNTRYGKDGIHEPLDWTEVEEDVQHFREKYILPTIVETELKEQSMYNWLITLPLHTYDIREDESIQEAEKASDANAESSNSVQAAEKANNASAESSNASISVQEIEKASDTNVESIDSNSSTCRKTMDSEKRMNTVNGSIRASQ
ncbi:hypothetical protein R5R35_013310 [Gryllus longicercus]|uniref:Pseudouridylate synthase 1 homolog n=1 Tax=Gryllus longicercus TaxID=2509291 RepID=A0AAN9Z154_9ORTH